MLKKKDKEWEQENYEREREGEKRERVKGVRENFEREREREREKEREGESGARFGQNFSPTHVQQQMVLKGIWIQVSSKKIKGEENPETDKNRK